jgi:flagellar operon protein
MADLIPLKSVSPVQAGSSPGQLTGSKSIDHSLPSFADTLAQAQNIKFSNHAQKRLQSRDISLSDDGMARLANAVEKAEKRGGRESLVLMDDMAFIVNIKEHLVVTAMDTRNNGEGVFTKIDSVVLADPSSSNLDPSTIDQSNQG